jgi:hypothetical protein
VTLRAALAALVEHFRDLAHELRALATIVAQDAPADGSAFVDHFRDSVTGAQGLAEEGVDAAERALGATVHQADVAEARRQLTGTYRALADLDRALVLDVGSARHRGELARLADERPGVWASWARVVGDTVDRCVEHLHGVHVDLAQAFEELLDPDVVSVAVAIHTVGASGGTGESANVERARATERSEGMS